MPQFYRNQACLYSLNYNVLFISIPASQCYHIYILKHSIDINSQNTIEVHLIGNISLKDSTLLGMKVIQMAARLDNQGIPVNILADFTQGGETENIGYDLSSALFRTLRFNKLAAYGAKKKEVERIMKSIVSGGLENKIRFFDSRQQAEKWLS